LVQIAENLAQQKKKKKKKRQLIGNPKIDNTTPENKIDT
jgi:hypothetical protein